MSKVKIYKPAKTAMQSGRAKTKRWKLEFVREAAMHPDPIMGWNTMPNTLPQVHLWFATQEEALAYAAAKKLDAEVIAPKSSTVAPKSYAENFAANRRQAFDSKAQSD